MKRLLGPAAFFDPRGRPLAVARSLLALAQLSFILFTPDRDLLFTVPHPSGSGPCDGVDRISLWCVDGGQQYANPVARVVAVVILTAVIIGVKPRWLCIPHWYVAFSVIARLATVDGGSAIAEIICGLLIPLCLGDPRSNHWKNDDRPLSPAWRGSSYAAHCVLRAQIAIIYLDAALSKAWHPAWLHGRALRIIMQDPEYGAPDLVRAPVDWILKHGWAGTALTWSVMLTELGIGASMFFATTFRRYALGAAIVLHAAIMLLMGLFSFALVMIAAVTLASIDTSPRERYFLMPIEITLFDPLSASETDFAEHYGVMTAVMALDYPDQSLPTLEEYVTQMRQPVAATGPRDRWVAREDGHIIGTSYAVYPELENRHLATVRVIVTPARRREGIGTALLQTILPALRTRGRTVVVGEGVRADASGDLWARELGFTRTHAYVRQTLNLSEVAPDLWQHPVPDGFRLERWTGGAPEELIEQYARARAAILDAPIGDSSIEFEDWTPERVRAHEADLQARDVENRVVVAVHESSGEIAGITEIQLLAIQTDSAFQGDTAVAAGFRGHGLGLAIKGAMLRWLTAEQPAVVFVFTQTAHDNVHMIRINHALGYTTTATMAEVEVDVATLAKGIEGRQGPASA